MFGSAFVETRGGQRVRVWHWVLRSDSDDSGWAWTGQDRANRGRYGHGRDSGGLSHRVMVCSDWAEIM